jgi:glucan phosphoethanolaminetransferase (alkaline phosphatase superfamily)
MREYMALGNFYKTYFNVVNTTSNHVYHIFNVKKIYILAQCLFVYTFRIIRKILTNVLM